jgi:hypothetical protein
MVLHGYLRLGLKMTQSSINCTPDSPSSETGLRLGFHTYHSSNLGRLVLQKTGTSNLYLPLPLILTTPTNSSHFTLTQHCHPQQFIVTRHQTSKVSMMVS